MEKRELLAQNIIMEFENWKEGSGELSNETREKLIAARIMPRELSGWHKCKKTLMWFIRNFFVIVMFGVFIFT